MKEFEEWDKTNEINYATISGGRELCVKNERQNAWRAALEWALSNKTDSGYVGEVVIVDIIEKELLNNQTDNSPD